MGKKYSIRMPMGRMNNNKKKHQTRIELNAICARNASFLPAICWWVFVFTLSPYKFSRRFSHIHTFFSLSSVEFTTKKSGSKTSWIVFFSLSVQYRVFVEYVWSDYGCDTINSFRPNYFLRATLKFHSHVRENFALPHRSYIYQRSVLPL